MLRPGQIQVRCVHSPARSIVLIGMMGAGKSSVGRVLEKRTGLPRIDVDELIVRRAGMPIAQIFSRKGEDSFRDLESAVLQEIRAEDPAIVVCGGGVVLRDGNIEILKRLGTVVWLEAPVDILLERASRRRTGRCYKLKTRRQSSPNCSRSGCHFMNGLQIYGWTQQHSTTAKSPT